MSTPKSNGVEPEGINFQQVEKVINLVEAHQISGLTVEIQGLKIEVRKEAAVATPGPRPVASAMATPAAAAPEVAKADDSLTIIKSPMVGTYYASPSPEADPFVKVGDAVKKGDTVCVIEAMKLFNEIEADVTGIVEKILVNNAQGVEYGQELMLIRPEG